MTTPLKRARLAAGLTQNELTIRTGIASAMISRIERGKVNLDRVEVGTMRKLAQALDTTIDDLVTEPKGS